MDNTGNWNKLVRDIITEIKKDKDPLLDRLAKLSVPMFKKNFDSREFWKTVVETLEKNKYIVKDLSCPENIVDVEHNRKLVRLLSDGS